MLMPLIYAVVGRRRRVLSHDCFDRVSNDNLKKEYKNKRY